jgi:hypothetical protein
VRPRFAIVTLAIATIGIGGCFCAGNLTYEEGQRISKTHTAAYGTPIAAAQTVRCGGAATASPDTTVTPYPTLVAMALTGMAKHDDDGTPTC